jgi:hypothetical protein
MIKSCPYGTPDEYACFVEKYHSKDEYHLARMCANFAGWDSDCYKTLLVKYVNSTQLDINGTSKSATSSKGDPFEEVVRYFLKKGGVAREISSLSNSGKWQIDGAGTLHRENLYRVWGDADTNNAGNSLLLECKNYDSAVNSDDFCKYKSRMEKFSCQLGVFASTSGFSIHNGQGIAEEIHVDFRTKKYHLLLTIEDLCIVLSEDIPPLHILTIALNNARFDKYKIDKLLQKKMSEEHCRVVAKEFYKRFSSAIKS